MVERQPVANPTFLDIEIECKGTFFGGPRIGILVSRVDGRLSSFCNPHMSAYWVEGFLLLWSKRLEGS